LVGFDKVSLDPGQTKHVQLTIDPRLLGHFDVAGHRWRIDAGSFGFAVGESSRDLPLKGEVKLAASEVVP
jgi:beta-glucosidase